MAKKRSILDRYTASQKYIVSRGKALTFPASPFKKELKNDEVCQCRRLFCRHWYAS